VLLQEPLQKKKSIVRSGEKIHSDPVRNTLNFAGPHQGMVILPLALRAPAKECGLSSYRTRAMDSLRLLNVDATMVFQSELPA
jgi:hypothetical protein